MESLLESFKTDVEGGDCDAALAKLSKLKLALLGGNAGDDAATRQLTRSTLEWGCLLAVRSTDTEAFQRNMLQLKTYYTDFSESLPPSELQNAMLGLNLLHLLMENRLAEFHSELELIPQKDRTNECIAFPVRIEQFLMVGSYDKVLAMRSNVPQEYFSYLMTSLVDTVRYVPIESLPLSLPPSRLLAKYARTYAHAHADFKPISRHAAGRLRSAARDRTNRCR
jgi:26S proteasome regulatory subunit N12